METEGERSGLDVSSGELHFLDLFRCVVEEDRVLTPLISDGIRQQLSVRDLQSPIVMVQSYIPRCQGLLTVDTDMDLCWHDSRRSS